MASLRKRGKVWYFAFIDSEGRRVERKGCSDRQATREMAREAEAEAARIKAGLVDPKELARREHAAKPVSHHVAAWGEALAARGGTERHVSMSVGRVRRLIAVARGAEPSEAEYPRTASMAEREEYEKRLSEWLKAGRLGDLTPEAVQRALGALRARGMSLQSLNHHRAAVRSFAIWCHDTNRLRENTLRGVKGFNAKEDRRHDRRTISLEELKRIVEAAAAGPVVLGMTGPCRALCYRLAVASGLRFSELASIKPGSFGWEDEPATVSVEPSYTKNGEPAVQPIPPDLAVDLMRFVATIPPDEPVFPLPHDRGAEMLRADLAAAGVPYADASGRFFDFHSLRCQTATLLDAAGVSPRVAQRIMRHSTPGLTDRYTKPRAVDVDRAVMSIPPLAPAKAHPSTMAATGTDDQPINDPFAAHLPHAGDVSGRYSSHADVTTKKDGHSSMERFPRKTGDINEGSRPEAASFASDRAGTRTQDQRINIPHRLSPTGRHLT